MKKILNISPLDKSITQLTTALNQLIDDKLSINLITANVANGSTTLITTSLTVVRGYILVSSSANVNIWKTATQPTESNQINITANNTANITLLVF